MQSAAGSRDEMQSESVTRRTAVACEECRRKKTKCDGVRPVCTPCQTTLTACHFSADTETRKRKKYSDDYVASLEDQIAEWKAYAVELEASQHGFRQPNGLKVYLSDHAAGESPPSLEKSATSTAQSLQLEIEAPEVDHLSTEESPGVFQESLDQRSRTAVEELGAVVWRMHIGDSGEPSFTGPSGNLCLSDPDIPQGNQSDRNQFGLSDITERAAIFAAFAQDLELKQYLIELFMTYINTLHMFVQVDASFSPAAYPHQDLGLQLLHTAIFAAGTRYSNRENIHAIGDLLMKHAETIALPCCRTHPSVTVVQSLGILCFCELSLQHDNMAWVYNSVCGSLTTSLGLHAMGLKELAGPAIAKSSDERISRTRTFWSFFFMDRIITTLLGRHCAIPWQRVDTPSFGSVLATDATLEEIAFDHECRLWFLHDQHMDQIYGFSTLELQSSARDRLLLDAREALLSFYSKIHSSLQFKKSGMPKSAIILQMSYQMSVTLMHRPYLRESASTSICTLALRSMTISASATTRLLLMFSKVDTLNNAPPFIIHHILTAAIMHLLNATDPRTELRTPASNKLRICLSALDAMRATWPRAAKAIVLIQELARRWAVVGALPIKFSNSPASEAPLLRSQPPQPLESAKTAKTTNADAENHRAYLGDDPAPREMTETATNAAQWQDEGFPFIFDDAYLDSFSYAWNTPEYVPDYNFAQHYLDDLHVATDYAVCTDMNANGITFLPYQ